MAKIDNGPPKQPLWPWGGPNRVRERLVNPAQVDRKKKAKKAGDPKNPALASAELLESIGYARGADDLRLPEPPMPKGHEADLGAFMDGPHLAEVLGKYESNENAQLEQEFQNIQCTPERRSRMEALWQRERAALDLISEHRQRQLEVRARVESEQEKRY